MTSEVKHVTSDLKSQVLQQSTSEVNHSIIQKEFKIESRSNSASDTASLQGRCQNIDFGKFPLSKVQRNCFLLRPSSEQILESHGSGF